MKKLVLISGISGAGKSTISRKVASELGILYVDTGAKVQKSNGVKIFEGEEDSVYFKYYLHNLEMTDAFTNSVNVPYFVSTGFSATESGIDDHIAKVNGLAVRADGCGRIGGADDLLHGKRLLSCIDKSAYIIYRLYYIIETDALSIKH